MYNFALLFLFRMIKNLLTKKCFPIISTFCGVLFFNAQCNPVTEFSENFDAYSCCTMGVVPNCWSSIRLNNASQIISSTQPASGTSQIYQFGYGTGTISIVIMRQVSNINAGTHQFRVKMKANSAGYLEFGYITDPADANTFVVLQPININNTSYTDSAAERIFTVPTTVPSGARLAIRNPGTSFAGHYWDDAVWEEIQNLSTNENDLHSGIAVYPNPFNDVLNISETKDLKTVTITDAAGRLIKTVEKPSTVIQLSDLEKGVYFVTLHFKNGTNKSFKSIKN
jgi:hypothetical protein